MRKIQLGSSGLSVPTIATGCMRITSLDENAAASFVSNAMELGLDFFDHADIYARGESEALFSRAVKAAGIKREDMLIQTKCGIRSGVCYDHSKTHILTAVEGSLKRLGTDYVDVLLLHRPDALMEPEEVAAAFDALHSSGKVRHFGVSNYAPGQIRLLQKYVQQPLVANQLQLSLAHSTMIGAGMFVNRSEAMAQDRDGGVLDFCRLENITIQPWSPFQTGGPNRGVFIGHEAYSELNTKLAEVAAKYGVTPTTIAIAWLLRHPAKMQPVLGTTKTGRLAECAKAAEITITREEWYELWLAAGNTLP